MCYLSYRFSKSEHTFKIIASGSPALQHVTQTVVFSVQYCNTIVFVQLIMCN